MQSNLTKSSLLTALLGINFGISAMIPIEELPTFEEEETATERINALDEVTFYDLLGSMLCVQSAVRDNDATSLERIFQRHSFDELSRYFPEGMSNLLLSAGEHNAVDAANLLFQHGGDFLEIYARDSEENTPLFLAVKSDSEEMTRWLLDHNADPNVMDKNQDTPLHIASLHGNLPIMDALLQHNADINAHSKFGRTPLHVAAHIAGFPVVDFLLQHGAAADAKDIHDGTPLHLALTRCLLAPSQDVFLIAEALIRYGADVNAKDDSHFTPLYRAYLGYDTKVGKLLKDHGAVIIEEQRAIAAEMEIFLRESEEENK